MGRRDDFSSVLVIGSGPIVIGQACEFDYSGSQACRVLKEEGFKVILANSNPATIMTDPDFADRTYIEPLDLEILTSIIEKERPDVLLPTLGGQTALNLAMELSEAGVLDRFGVRMIGANALAIKTAENRDLFKAAMGEIGLKVPESGFAHSLAEAVEVASMIGYPLIIRPSFILGGAGTGIAKSDEEFCVLASQGLVASPVSEILIERSIAGWKEFELEVMRDSKDNAVIVCSIENFDPMGIHTGDSITVAPAQTLTDVEYQKMRDAAFAVIRRIGVETGGSNIQFAIDPDNGEMVVIEMNPRVSRSSALASKATGFPIAKIATKLAIGYSLAEVQNDITKLTPASFEPTIDYVVTKVPRWAFEKFPGVQDVLGTRMQSVGEAMAIGRTFAESFQKAFRSIELGRSGLNGDEGEAAVDSMAVEDLLEAIKVATPMRPFQIESALRRGADIDQVYHACKVDPWFLAQIRQISHMRLVLGRKSLAELSKADFNKAKRMGFSDDQIAYLTGATEAEVRSARLSLGVKATFKAVDTCSAEFEAFTPYHYSTYEDEDEVVTTNGKRVIILGSGPNRIGQGIEFDYCCVHASFALREAGFETVMINCNPETVSTDYDTSNRLYIEPLTPEDVANIIDAERASTKENGEFVGVIVALGGQTPLKIAGSIDPAIVLGTSPEAIDIAEDRQRWSDLCSKLDIPQPAGATVFDLDQAFEVVARIGYPVLVRPSYVLGGRAMEIVYNDDQLIGAMERLSQLHAEGRRASKSPVLVDRFLEDAIEVDVDALRDVEGNLYIGAIMEHVEEAGVHSGDSACAIPPPTLTEQTKDVIRDYARSIADALSVVGLINIQFAVKSGQVFVIEANPRASRTVPFVAKATGVPLAKLAALVMVGKTLPELNESGYFAPPELMNYWCVKEAVLPFSRFPLSDILLGPEMRSTGEVMGVDSSFEMAFIKSQLAAGTRLPSSGLVFLSLADRDKVAGVDLARQLVEVGFALAATAGTARAFSEAGVPVERVVAKLGDRDNEFEIDPVDLISSGSVGLVVNTPRGSGPRTDGHHIRTAALGNKVACVTTMAAALAAVSGMVEWSGKKFDVVAIQDYHNDGGDPGVGSRYN
ncbi:MAG: carbamoyl-phosphate synthase large subunit [Acidimicrobiaceae bacterium]|nr:carbamoyl-phosphate synthase large subunit [Acidimicrobiaceae bacterium]